jgi:5-methylcytosine-specific restriction endonuclease McrA
MKIPVYLSEIDPTQRFFPSSWKTAYWRLNGGLSKKGYQCPGCLKRFKGSEGFLRLQADHKKAYALGGSSIWENMQLLCNSCNNKKSYIY